MRYKRCFSEEQFSGGNISFRYLCIEVFWYTKVFMNCSAAWLQEDSLFNWLKKLPICVISSTRRKLKILSDPSIYLFLAIIFNQRIDLLFLDGFQCCCDIQNLPIWNLVKWRSLVCGYISRENFHYSIHYSVVIIDHGGETVLEQGGGTRWVASMKNPGKYPE